MRPSSFIPETVRILSGSVDGRAKQIRFPAFSGD